MDIGIYTWLSFFLSSENNFAGRSSRHQSESEKFHKQHVIGGQRSSLKAFLAFEVAQT